jgi:polyketide cyclase/dehydrase/lipid transport protein
MIEIRLETEASCTAPPVFEAIVDLGGYDRWLTRSSAYPGTTEITGDPIGVGTTYVESSSSGVRRGTITEFEAPTRVTFHQPMTMKPRFLGVIDIHVTYQLTPGESSVHIGRFVRLALSRPLLAVRPLVVRQFRAEGERTLSALKAFAETQ